MKKNYLVVRAMTVLMFSFLMFNNLNAQLYINEFMASNDISFPGPQGDYPDWIEIYNNTSEPVMLGGYYISDALNDTSALFQIPDTYPDSVTVPAFGYILFYANKGEESSVLNLNFKLSGGGEAIGFWTSENIVIDTMSYGDQTTDVSYGRYPDGSDFWGFMIDITPGAANTNPTPAEIELYINEFMASNDLAFPGPQGDYPDWIEIYNAGDEAVMLGGYYLYDTLNAAEAYQIPDTYPDSVTVEPGGFILFYANKGEESSVLNLNFKLSGGGEQVGLWNPDQELLDGITYGDQITDTSYGRYHDGTENWYLMSDFTPGESNVNPNVGPTDILIYINEFMASNDAAFAGPQGDYPDWIEIYNAGEEAVMLGGYYMSDDLIDPEAMYQIPSTYPDSVTVEAGGFILFYANKGEESSVLNLNFKLSGGGEQVGLWSPEQVFLDSLTYGPQIADTSFGRYTDGTDNWFMMPDFTPGAANIYTSSVNEIEDLASISQNFPNPFSTVTNVQFTLEKRDNVVINVYDVRGSLVTVLVNENYSKGTHTVKWDAASLPTGHYFYSLHTSTGVVTKKASVIR
ncbi:MAG: lamin tail domain-containing protein [Bacteroidota bacterium]